MCILLVGITLGGFDPSRDSLVGGCVMYGRLHSDKCNVDIGFGVFVLGGICVKLYFGKNVNVHKSLKQNL